MPALPTGTITFLFTDVAGSSRLWEAHPRAMRQVMARHDALPTQVFEQHDGVVLRPRGEGDGLFAVFIRATDAVAAAAAGQYALATADWNEIGPLPVRMGLHTGEADLRDGEYYGTAVNRGARLCAIAHGGQVLLSHATAALVETELPAEVDLEARNPKTGPGATASRKLDFSDFDRADPDELNRILWEALKPGKEMPAPVRSAMLVWR